jgi:hypothetical protein
LIPLFLKIATDNLSALSLFLNIHRDVQWRGRPFCIGGGVSASGVVLAAMQ